VSESTSTGYDTFTWKYIIQALGVIGSLAWSHTNRSDTIRITECNDSEACEHCNTCIGTFALCYDTSNRSKNVFFKVSSCVDFQGRWISDGSNGHLCDMRYRARVWYYMVWLLLFIQWLECFSSFSGKVWKFWWTILERQHNFLKWRVHPIIWYFGFVSVLRKTASIRWTTDGSIITRTGCINWSGIHPPAVSLGVSGILNSDMKASPTVSNPYPSHPDLSRLDWEIGHWQCSSAISFGVCWACNCSRPRS